MCGGRGAWSLIRGGCCRVVLGRRLRGGNSEGLNRGADDPAHSELTRTWTVTVSPAAMVEVGFPSVSRIEPLVVMTAVPEVELVHQDPMATPETGRRAPVMVL